MARMLTKKDLRELPAEELALVAEAAVKVRPLLLELRPVVLAAQMVAMKRRDPTGGRYEQMTRDLDEIVASTITHREG